MTENPFAGRGMISYGELSDYIKNEFPELVELFVSGELANELYECREPMDNEYHYVMPRTLEVLQECRRKYSKTKDLSTHLFNK